jgi:hypothetical protein
MSLLAKEVTALLTRAINDADATTLQRAYERLLLIHDEALVLGPTQQRSIVSPDLFLFCAETALAFPDQMDIARRCVERLVEEGTASTPAYAVRALYARAAVERHDAAGLRGSELVLQAQSSLALVVQGIKRALTDPANLSHLVHAGTEHLWNSARLLYHEGTYGDIVNVLAFAVQALEKIEYADARTRAVWLFRHATALAACGRANEAAAIATKANDLVMKSAPTLKYWSFRMQVGLTKVLPNPKVKADAKGVMKGVCAAHSVLCGAVDEASAEPDILASITEVAAEMKALAEREQADERSGGLSPGAASAASAAASKKGPPNGKKDGAANLATASATNSTLADIENAAREETYAELGLAAAFVGQLKIAAEVANKAAVSKRLIARVYSDYTKALIQAAQAGGIALQEQTDFSYCSPEAAHELLNAVRRIDRALESALRVSEPTERNFVVQQGAVLLWNLALPLLQPSTRALVAKSLQNAVKALDETGSNLGLLRAQMHLEVATTDADAQYVSKAANRVQAALEIDYQPPADHVKLYGLAKPLDRYLSWLKRCLQVKLRHYEKPDNVEDEALMVIEQASDANPQSRISMLSRAVAALEASEPPADFYTEAAADVTATSAATGIKGGKPPAKVTASPGGKRGADASTANGADQDGAARSPELEAKRTLLRNRTLLWSRVMQLGWESKAAPQIPLCRSAAGKVLARTWTRRGDRDMKILQANAAMILAETYAVELKKAGVTIGQKNFLAENDDDDGDHVADDVVVQAATQRAKLLAASQSSIQEHVVAAATIGASLVAQDWPDQYIVCNAATALWNYFCPAFAQGDFFSAAGALEAIFPLLDGLNLDARKEASLLSDFALAYTRSLLQQYIKEKMNLSETSVADMVALQTVDTGSFPTIDANHAKLTKASEVCERLISILPTPMDAMRFIQLSVVIRRLQGKPADTRADAQQRVITAIEQCRIAIPVEEKRTVLASIHGTLAQDPNVELCARLAERCLTVPGCERVAVRVCTVGQQLYAEGKLGHRRTEAPTSSVAAPGAKGAAAAKGSATDKKAAAATAAITAEPEKEAPPPVPTEDDWTWYALLLQYQASAVAALIDPSVQDKPTQHEIRKQCLTALTNSAIAATRAVPERKAMIIMKNIRLYARIAGELAAHASTRAIALPSLKLLLSPNVVNHVVKLIATKPSAGTKNDAAASQATTTLTDVDALARLYLMLVTANRDGNNVDAGLTAMKNALKLLPASHHKPFWDLDVELRCQAGLPLNQTLLRVKEYDPETQARVWMALARHSPDRKNQLFGYQNAIAVLEQKPTEKAFHLLALAQWMLVTNYTASLDDVRVLLLSAIDLVSDRVDVEAESQEQLGGADGGSGGDLSNRSRLTHRSQAAGSASSADAQSMRGSERPAGAARTHGTSSSVAAAAAAKAKPTVREYVLVIQAYFMLAKIAGPSTTLDGSPLDTRSCLAAASHYVLRLWDLVAAAASQHMLQTRIKQQHTEARAAQLAAASGADAKDPAGGAAAAAGGKGARKAAAANPATAAANGRSAIATEPSLVLSAAQTQGNGKAEGLLPDDIAALTLPNELSAWLTYHPSNLLIHTLRNLSSCPQAPSANTVPAPSAFLSMLHELAAQLHRHGLSLESLAALALTNVIAQVLLPPGPVLNARLSVAHLEAAQVCLALNAASPAASHRVLNLLPDPAEQAALLEDARVEAARMAGHKGGAAHADPAAPLTPSLEDGVAGRSMAAAASARALAPSFGIQLPTAAVQLRDPSPHIHALWVRIAECLVAEGRTGMAARLLDEAQKHALRYGDAMSESRIHALHGRILSLEGHDGRALTSIRHATTLLGACIPLDVLVQYKLLEVTILMRLNDIDTVFALEREVQAAFAKQLQMRAGLHRAVAAETVPAIATQFAVGFVRNVIDGYRDRVDARRRPSKQVLEKVRDALDAAINRGTTKRDGKDAKASDTLTSPTLSTSPAANCDVALLHAELERLEFNASGGYASLQSRKRLLHREATRLRRCVEQLRAQLDEGVETSDANGTALRQAAHRKLGRATLRLAENLMETVQLRRETLAAYRTSSETLIAFPRVAGASANQDTNPPLEAKIVEFMRSSKKMRDAAAKRHERTLQRSSIEEARVTARAEKQRVIDDRREQKKLDELNAPPQAAKKDSAKAAKPGKGGAPMVNEDPDVDANDTCGIESPPRSDDEGDAEDSATESDEETCHAVRSMLGANNDANPNPATAGKDSPRATLDADDQYVVKATMSEAIALALEAKELFGAGNSVEAARARILHATATRLMADDEVQGLEARRAILEGKPAPPASEAFFDSVTSRNRWSAVMEGPPEESEASANATGPVKKGAAGAAAPGGKKAPAAIPGGKGAPGALPTSPTPDIESQGRQSTAADKTVLAPRPRLVHQALNAAHHAAAAAYRTANSALLADALFECACSSMGAGLPIGTVGAFLTGSHAAAVESFVTSAWLSVAPADAVEASMLRTVKEYLNASNHPAVANTPMYASAVAAAAQGSKMFSRLRVPDVAMQAMLQPEAAAECFGGTAPTLPPLPALPADVVVLTLLARHDGRQLFAVVHRAGKDAEVRRAGVVDGALDQLHAASARYNLVKRAALSSASMAAGSMPNADEQEAIEMEFGSVCRALTALLAPLLHDFRALFDSIAAKMHLVICADPLLQPLPLEAVPALMKFRSVSRDISLYTVLARVARRSAEKFSGAAATFVCDPQYEHPSRFAQALFNGDDKPKTSQWSLVTPQLDEGGAHRVVSTAAIQKAVVQPPHGANSVVVATCGALPASLPLPAIAATDLTHLRFVGIMDNNVTAAAVRRENQLAMTKSDAIKFAEQPWLVAMLLLARGAECCIANTSAVAPSTTEAVLRAISSNLEKSQIRNFAEVLRVHLHRTLPVMQPDSDLVTQLRTTNQNPADGDAFKCWHLAASDRLGFVVFGLSPDDGAPVIQSANKK